MFKIFSRDDAIKMQGRCPEAEVFMYKGNAFLYVFRIAEHIALSPVQSKSVVIQTDNILPQIGKDKGFQPLAAS